MAACLITVGGTYGEILFNYIDSGSVAHSVVSGPGTFYLDDSGSNYTYSVLYGDVTASSGCITLTNSPFTCYLIHWASSSTCDIRNQYVIQSLIVGSNEYSLYEKMSVDAFNAYNIATAINDLGYPVVTAPAIQKSSKLIVKTLNGEIPYLKLSDDTTSYNIYLKGTPVVDCIPAGYTEMNIWPVIPVTTTTTSTTTTTTLAP